MKMIRWAAAFTIAAGLPLASPAQSEKPAAGMAPGEAKAEAKAEAPRLSMQVPKGRRSRADDVDARECLRFPTNREIHICAEKYRR